MSDQDIIKEAYQDSVKKIFSVFLDSYVGADGDQPQIDAAKKRFKAGIGLARTVRDAALSLL